MNFKKILLGLVAVALTSVSLAPVANAAINDPEFDAALMWMSENGLTKYNTAESFMPYATLTREQAAKFLSTFAVTNLCLEVVDSASCDFSDVPADPSLGEYVALACELGLVKGSNGKYMPTAPMTKAAVITVLSRAMAAAEGKDAPSEDVAPRWANHLTAARAAGITKETNAAALDRSVTRYEVALMLYRARVDAAECSDVDVEDLLNDLFGDDTTDDTATGDDTTDDVVTESNGTVKAMLSSATPNGVTLPGKVTAKVATFEFAATTEDVVLSEVTLTRKGLGADAVVDKLTLFANGELVTKSKSFNSDDEVILTLNPTVTIKKGEKLMLDVVATLGDAAVVSNQEFSVALSDFATNGIEDKANLEVVANTFRIGGVNGAAVVVSEDGNVSDVDLGDTAVEVAKFEVKNNSNDSDVTITSITLEDTEKNADEDLKNFVLKHNGTQVGAVAMSNGKYVTFTLSTPVVVKKNETEDLRVYADVIAGAGDKIAFDITNAIYVQGKDSKYGYGLAVDVSLYDAQSFDINAGELTLVENKLPTDKVRQDTDDVVLASFNVNVNAGKDLSLEDIKFVLNGTATGTSWGTLFENTQLVVTVAGTKRTYDLNLAAGHTNATATWSDTDLGILLPAAKAITIELIADSITTYAAADLNRDFTVTMGTNALAGFEVIENDDDTKVTDIVPSSIQFDKMKLVSSNVTVSRLSLGVSANGVIGTKNLDAIKFQVRADDVSSVFVNAFTFSGSASGCVFNSTSVSAAKLWKQSGTSGWTEVEAQGGFEISNGMITFDDFAEIEVAKSATQVFLLTLDIADDDNLNGCSMRVNLQSADIEDDDNKDLVATGTPTAIGRILNITSAGTLTVSTELNDSKVSRAKHVLAGTTSDYVAAFDLVAKNEGVNIEDIQINVAGVSSSAFQSAVTDVLLYNEAGTLLYQENVVGSPVLFDNINFVIPEGTTTVFVKLMTDFVGDSENGSVLGEATLTLSTLNAEGDDSGADIADATAATQSYAFDVIPVHVSNLEFVNSYGGYSVTTSYASNTTDTNLAILKVTANTWSNTLSTSPDTLDLVLKNINFTLPAGVTNVTLKRIDIANGAEFTGANVVYSTNTVDNTITKGSVAYYLLQGDVATSAGTFTVRINALDGGSNFVYASSDAAYGNVTKPLIGKNVLENVVETKYQP